MKVINLTNRHSTIYTSNVYLITGNWNTLKDKNTLVDVGRDRGIIEEINKAATGVGKQKIEQVVITHSHYDHASLLPEVKDEFNPKVYAYSSTLEGVDHFLKGEEILTFGDREFGVIHSPGHSSDSICLFCEHEGVLFAGDSPVIISSEDGTYDERFIKVLEKISSMDIKTIYLGHGEPIIRNCRELLRASLQNARNSRLLKNKNI